MNDIDYCVGTNCPLKIKCKRHLKSLVYDGRYNTWWAYPAYSEKKKKCVLFVEDKL